MRHFFNALPLEEHRLWKRNDVDPFRDEQESARVMSKLGQDSLADIEFRMNWRSDDAVHTEAYYAQRVNCGWDIIPKTLHEQLISNSDSELIEYELESDDARFTYDSRRRFFIRQSQFDRGISTGQTYRAAPWQGLVQRAF